MSRRAKVQAADEQGVTRPVPEQTQSFIAHLQLSVLRWKRDAIHFENAGAYHLARQVRKWIEEAEQVIARQAACAISSNTPSK